MQDKPVMICHVEKSVSYTLHDCKWIPGTAKFVVIGARPRGSGVIEVYQVVTNDLKLLKTVKFSYNLYDS